MTVGYILDTLRDGYTVVVLDKDGAIILHSRNFRTDTVAMGEAKLIADALGLKYVGSVL